MTTNISIVFNFPTDKRKIGRTILGKKPKIKQIPVPSYEFYDWSRINAITDCKLK